MNGQEIYKLAAEMTEQHVLNVISGWEDRNEVESIKDFNWMVKMGDSKQVACATVMVSKSQKDQFNYEFYRNAYEN
jgi:hypothetical protein